MVSTSPANIILQYTQKYYNNVNEIKTIIFGIFIVAMILPFSSMSMAEVPKTLDDFKTDIRNLFVTTSEDSMSMEEIKREYNTLLRNTIEQSRLSTETSSLSEIEIQGVIDYIIYETIKDEKIKDIISKEDEISDVKKRSRSKVTCPDTIDPVFRQLNLDIRGGSYGEFTFNGNNTLYKVVEKPTSKSCEKHYVLYFYDEDHPDRDAFYDEIRSVIYQRVHDEETVTIVNNNQLKFIRTWSSTHDYDDLCFVIFGCHETTTKEYTPGQVIYVSNTWNHMMDTTNTNAGLSTTIVP